MTSIAIETRKHHRSIIELTTHGVLAAANLAELRDRIDRYAITSPPAIVLDLNRLDRVESRAAVAIPGLQRRYSREIPPVALVIHARAASPAAQALHAQLRATTPVVADLTSSVVRASAGSTAQVHLDDPGSAMMRADRFVHRTCRGWLISWLANRIQLVTGELLANALAHTGGPATVMLSLIDRYVRVSVQDTSARLPHVELRARPWPGRGLGLVDLVCRRWGTHLTATGKVIWADIPLALR